MIQTFKSYSELIKFESFIDRFRYLKLDSLVGEDTFGYNRYLNQRFYTTREWMRIRDYVITRDLGCDLGVTGYEIPRNCKIIIHHMNPITEKDIITRSDYLLDPEFLITTTHVTHNAIHYGVEEFLVTEPIERTKNDTCPWKNLPSGLGGGK